MDTPNTAPYALNEPHYDVLWPLTRRSVASAALASRLDHLNGKTVAELWDWNFRGETIYPRVRDHVRSRFPGVRFIDYTHFGNIHGPDAEQVVAGLPDKLRALGCDAAIVGIGA